MNLNPYLHIKSFSPAHAVSYKIPFIILYNLLIQLILTCKLCLPTSPYGHCVLADVAICQVCRSGKDIFPQQTVNSGSYHLEICWCLSPSYSQLTEISAELIGEVWIFPMLVLLNLMQTFWRSSHLPVGSASKREIL